MTRWGDVDDVIAEGYRKDARAAIEAAMPAIREHIAQEIEQRSQPMPGTAFAEAARIVRGDAS